MRKGYLKLAAHSNSTIISTSTGELPGSPAMPTAERACLPASPNTSTMRSENPLTTSGWSPKPSAELTMPSTLTTRLTRSRLPSADLCEHDEASLPCRLSALLHCEVLAELAFAHPRRACGVARQE